MAVNTGTMQVTARLVAQEWPHPVPIEGQLGACVHTYKPDLVCGLTQYQIHLVVSQS